MTSRTAEDVRRDPQPRDVIKVASFNDGSSYTLTADYRQDVHINYTAKFEDEGRMMSSCLVSEWRKWAKHAEVIHIAQEAECK